MKSTYIGREISGIVLPVTLVLLLVLAISGTSLLQVVRQAGDSSNGYATHLESFYRAELALRATENALVNLVSSCPDVLLGACPERDTWIRISVPEETESGRLVGESKWRIHPHASAARGQVAYLVEFVEQGSFEDMPGRVYDIYRVRTRAGGPGYAAYSSLSTMIALCVANEMTEDSACKSRGFRGSWQISSD